MSTAAVSPLSSAGTGVPAALGSSQNLGQGDFLNLLVAQLKNQDPLNPTSGTDFTAQLAQFSTLSGVQQLNTNISSMLLLQGLTQGSNLIGKTVKYAPKGSAQQTSGVVTSIGVSNGSVQLMVGQTAVPINQVLGIQASAAGSN